MLKCVNKNDIALWIHRNARELEIARWKYHFEGGDKEAVIRALMQYQNPDGGFGSGLDPDNWNPNSLAYATFYALGVLNEIEFYDMEHPIYKGIYNYICKEAHYPEQWVFTVPSNGEYPHAVFYNYSEEYNKVESLGIILAFSAFVIEYAKESPIYQDVVNSIETYINRIFTNDLGDMGVSGYIILIDAMKKVNLAGYDYDRLEKRLKDIVYASIQRDPKQWPVYGYRPSAYIKSPVSAFYEENEEIVEMELDFLADTLPEGDVWPITWSWFDNNEKYPKEQAISEVWGKAYKTVEYCIFLKNFDRLTE